MYIVFGNRVVDSKDFIKLIEENTEFKVIKDMSKGSKREDVVALNLSMKTATINEDIEGSYNLNDVDDDTLFEEYMALTEEMGYEIEEYLPDDSIMKFTSYKWDPSDEDIKSVIVIVNEELGELKCNDIMKRLLKQVE